MTELEVTRLHPLHEEDATPVPDESPPLPITFLGTTGHYFRIYATNAMLSLLTLGIYSAWAKVRNRNFFYGHTQLHGQRFSFDARPLSILISRILVVVFLVLIPQLELSFDLIKNEIGLLSTLALVLLPFATIRGRSFNARHTVFMGVRFHYQRIYQPIYRIFVLFTLPFLLPWIIFALLSAELYPDERDIWTLILVLMLVVYFVPMAPVWFWMRHKVKINQLSFGKLGMRYLATCKQYYLVYLHSAALLMLGIIMILGFALFDFALFDIQGTTPLRAAAISLTPFILFLWVLYCLALLTALFWNSIGFTNGGRLQAKISPLHYLLNITVLNLVILVLSLGILLPWIRVRKWRYISSRLTVHPGSFSAIIDQPDAFREALGAEYLDLEGLDLDIGFI